MNFGMLKMIAPAALTASLVTAPTALAATGNGWTRTPVPVTGSVALYSVTATGKNNAWASGATMGTPGSGARYRMGRLAAPSPHAGTGCSDHPYGPSGSVMLRWNGTAWTSVAVPAVGDIFDVNATSATNAWAGANCSSLHWDGKSWTATPYAALPNMAGFVLSGLSSHGTNDAWMSGTVYAPDGSTSGYVERWGGTRWQQVSLPGLGANVFMGGIASLGANDVWVTGTDGDQQTILLHWDGHSWTRSAEPATGYKQLYSTSVKALGPDDVWVTGTGIAAPGPAGVRQALMMHWDGHRWTNTQTPVPPTSGNQNTPSEMYTVAGDNGQLWAGGDTFQPNISSGETMAVLRLAGTKWVSSPVPAAGMGSVDGLTAIPGGGLWSVGHTYVNDPSGPTVLTPVIARKG